MPSAFRKIAAKVKQLFKRAESLSDIIKKEIRVDKKTRKQLLETKHPLWMPSASSTFKMVGLMGIAWIVSHPTEILNKIILPINGLANNLLYYAQTTRPIKGWMRSLQWPALPLIPNDFDPIAIHAGVGAILVGLIFFVAGSLLDKNEPEKARVLLYKSNLFPLLIVETLAFFFFIGETNWFAVIILVIIAILTLVSFGRVVDVLLHEHKLEEAKKDILLSVTRSAFVKLLDREITKRVWFNCLYKRYENSEILNFSPFGFWGEKKEVVAIKSTKDGYIKELKLKILEKLTSEINRAITDTANNADITKTAANSSQQKKTPAGYMRKSLNDGVRVGETLYLIEHGVI
ncbi:hypothetical protein IPG41_06045 [Candidatus Peregrinibacteria bacterium]|nr:MAG: hypothetical protein IPG41_06045 [Candidatus Peregrinibacteria bacterium]